MNKDTMRRAFLPREPIGAIENDAGKEAGLGHAKGKAQRVEARVAETKVMAIATSPR